MQRRKRFLGRITDELDVTSRQAPALSYLYKYANVICNYTIVTSARAIAIRHVCLFVCSLVGWLVRSFVDTPLYGCNCRRQRSGQQAQVCARLAKAPLFGHFC